MKIHLHNHRTRKKNEYQGDIDSVKQQIVNDYPGFKQACDHLPTSDFFQYLDSSHLVSVDIKEATDEENDLLDEFDEGWRVPVETVTDTPKLDVSLNLPHGLKDIVIHNDNDADGDEDE